ncbi:PAS domain-containing sensor histidine kinase, partial [Siphonobacter sp. BAB-5385]|uniref:PAS domain-containing protein n=1 Tax=Siphonobacter sp. BAB-5385 TaxID=1864822 RepID=UPI000BC6CB0A
AQDHVIPYEQAIQFIHPDDVDRVNQAVEQVLTGKSNGNYDQTYRTVGADDGILRWVRFYGKAYFSQTGDLYRFGGVAQDVTQQVRTQQSLTVSEARSKNLVTATPAATAILVGPDLLIQHVNAPMLAIWGRDESVLGKTLLEAMPDLEGQPCLAQLQHVFDTGQPVRHSEEVAYLMTDGRPKTVYFNHVYNPLYDQDGSIYGVINTAIDVTEQVTARQALQESEARFVNIIQQSPAATMVLRGDEFVIDQINTPMLGFFGRGKEVIGQPLLAVMPELKEQFAWQQAQ